MELIINENKPTICLNMIVKNESKIITRLFTSVLPIIDCYCICDTGSTDNTVQLIQEFFISKNISGKVVVEPFKNFCHNRNFALTSCIGMSDYVLLLDADMILEITNFDKNMLKDYDYMHLLQGNNDFYYQNTRIIKNNGLFKYIGVTHEYISTPENSKSLSFKKDQLFINDRGDGGCKSDKFERDVRLLTEGIKEEPKNDRYHFYLANSLTAVGENEKAIEMYKKRIELGGWCQEIWYSYYKMATSYKDLGQVEKAICTWMEAYDYLPERIENLYEIIKHYRYISKHKLCLFFYNLANDVIKQNKNKDDYLFLHNDVYTYKIDYEFTIFASYIGVKNINNQVISVLNNCSDSSTNDNLLNNMKFYKDILKSYQIINFDSSIEINVNSELTNFYSSSSCLIHNPNGDGYLMNIRYVNYFINNQGNYLYCDKHIITANKFVELSKDFRIIKEKLFDINFEDRRYIGIEDVRIFNDNNTNKLLFMGTGYHKNNTLGIVEGNYDINKKKLMINEIKPSFSNSGCEKNWVYVDYLDSPHVIYKWNPLQICKINKETNKLNLVETKNMPKIFSCTRGSTCGFKYKYTKNNTEDSNEDSNEDTTDLIIEETEIWFVLHIVSYESPRHYYHIFAVFDNSMNLLRYSAPFKFENDFIEYTLSIIVEEHRVLINYSVLDRTTKIGIYDKKYIDSLVKYK